jgi:hypothetical protein
MHPGMTIASPLPNFFTIAVPSKLTKKWSMVLKCKLPSSTEISPTFVRSNAPAPISTSFAGMQIDESDEQPSNARDSIRESLEPASNVTLESALHPSKQALPSISTDDGMQIDTSDQQSENA